MHKSNSDLFLLILHLTLIILSASILVILHRMEAPSFEGGCFWSMVLGASLALFPLTYKNYQKNK